MSFHTFISVLTVRAEPVLLFCSRAQPSAQCFFYSDKTWLMDLAERLDKSWPPSAEDEGAHL